RSHKFNVLIAPGLPAAKLELLVEDEVSRSLPVLHRQRGERLLFSMKFHHAAEIDRADDIDIVQNERLFKTIGILEEKIGSLFQSAAGVEQNLLARDFDAHAKVMVRFQIVENHVGKVMHIDNDLANPIGAQAGKCDL